MRRLVIDIEADGLLDEPDETKNATKIYCLCYYDIDSMQSGSLTTYEDIISLVTSGDVTLIGHKVYTYDIPLLEKMLGVKLLRQQRVRIIDTLILSWYLYPLLKKHGLEEWGEKLGITKPIILDWKNQTLEEYVHRCTKDVEINTKLLYLELDYLLRIYGSKEAVDRLINYLMFKGDCAEEQEEVKIKLDKKKAEENLKVLSEEKERKFHKLQEVMPPNIIYAIKNMPKVMYKQDGSISKRGKQWFEFLEEQGLPQHTLGFVKYKKGEKQGNPQSIDKQLKNWLYSLGWQPETFKYVRKKGADKYSSIPRAVAQISLLDGSDICPSVKALYPKEPNLRHIESFFVLRHRVGIIESMLNNMYADGTVQASIKGLTNTLRFKHAVPCVNLPTIMKPYGKMIRELLIAPDDEHLLCGSDVSGLEESTKHHYMSYYDPEYVKEMRQFGFDAHLDIAVLAKMCTKDEADWYKWMKADQDKKHLYVVPLSYVNLSPEEAKALKGRLAKVRDTAKKANFAAVYGAGAPKIALTAKISEREAYILHKIYWKRNWAVKKIAEACTVKTIGDQMWLYNPVSRFWYSLRYLKDRFSTLNQGTGVYVFDTWVSCSRRKGIRNCAQFHDEVVSPLHKLEKEQHALKLTEAMRETNEMLKLNITVGNSIDFGRSYADIH